MSLVSAQWLLENAASVVVLDASWYLPSAERDARAEYAAGHIPGARFFAIDEIAAASDLPHMLPSAEAFAAQVSALGVGNGDQVVVYDGAGLFSAPRAWWMFRAMGHNRVSVLDGGRPAYVAAGGTLESEAPAWVPTDFEARLTKGLIRDLDAMRKNLKRPPAKQFGVVDARSQGRFEGTAPEPRPGLVGGHIPGSANVPWPSILNSQGKLRGPYELEAIFEAAGVDISRPVVTTCGSGVTAALLALALAQVGRTQTAVYDGSWAEWGRPDQDVDTPVETGPQSFADEVD